MAENEDVITFRSSKWQRFDPEFAEMIRTEHPDIWKRGGNILGNTQYRRLYPITQRNGVPETDTEVQALKLREAWVARHLEDFRIAGVIAQIKWLAVGSRGEKYMKDLVREEIAKKEAKQSSFDLESYLAHYGVKGQKWGVRRSKKQLARARASQKTAYKSSPSKLSDTELKRRVSRMETEKRYLDLNPITARKGKDYTSKLMSTAGSVAVSTAVGAVTAKVVKDAITK